jgi:hypothetical protein
VIRNNFVHDNNNPDTPGAGIAAVAPVGVGIELSGTQSDLVVHNVVTNNNSWGIVAHDYPDTETFPSQFPASMDCAGGTGTSGSCFYGSGNNFITANTLSGNGGYGNPTNGDLLNEQIAADLVTPGKNCWSANTDGGGAASESPTGLQALSCTTGDPDTGAGAAELLCASGVIQSTVPPLPGCPQQLQLFSYPSHNATADTCAKDMPGSAPVGDACIIPLSQTLSTAALQPKMDPCVGPPPNAYCPAAAVTNQAPALPVAALPNTAPTGALNLVAIIGGGGVALMVVALSAWRRRVTRRS